MSDLIDLSSPENKKIQPPKLSSPLIPVPKDIKIEVKPQNCLILQNRRSLDDNPFDLALQEANDYISKCQDPFEIVFQTASTSEKKPNKPQQKLVDAQFKDDYCCKPPRHPGTVKLNKTLSDYPSPTSSAILFNEPVSLVAWKNCVMTDLTTNDLKEAAKHQTTLEKSPTVIQTYDIPLISVDPPQNNGNSSILNQSTLNNTFSDDFGRPSIGKFLNKTTSCIADTSILDQSAMNDSLSASGSSEDCLVKSIVHQRIDSCIKQALRKSELEIDNLTDQYRKLRRSLSHSDGMMTADLHKFKQLRSQSIVGDESAKKMNNISISSMIYDDPFNNGFLMVSRNNKYSTISDVSSITSSSTLHRLDSVGSNYRASSEDSSNPINYAFIKSHLSACETPMKMRRSITTSRLPSSNPSSLAEISDLVNQFNLLKLRTNLSTASSVFEEEKIFNDAQLNVTSDSVFIENDQQLKVANCDGEYKLIANKLETLNDSIGDDLLPKELPCELDLSLENEIRVDNLIELHTSNSFNNGDSNPPDKNNKSPPNNNHNNTTQDVKAMRENEDVKELKEDWIEPEKKPIAATLLMELHKLIKPEDNPKVAELLTNLEEKLGVKCQNNVELLEMFAMNIDENKSKNTNREGRKSPVNLSQEDNLKVDVNDDTNDGKLNVENNLNCDKKINKNKNLIIGYELEEFEEKIKNNFGKKNHQDEENEAEEGERVKIKKNPSMRHSLSPKKNYSLAGKHLRPPARRSIGSSSLTKPIQDKRRLSMSQISENKKSEIKLTSTSPRKEPKKRTSISNIEVTSQKPKNKTDQEPVKLKSSVPVFSKPKLKKKIEVNSVAMKKGPLKAMIPVGNMHKNSSIGMRVSIVVEPTTPPKSSLDVVPPTTPAMGKTSTPVNERTLDCLKKTKKTKPVAASTPDTIHKGLPSGLTVGQSPKYNMSWNISPVTPNAPRGLNSSGVEKNDSIKRVQSSNKLPVSSPKTRNGTPRRLEKSSTQQFAYQPPTVLTDSPRNPANKSSHARYSEPVKPSGLSRSVISDRSQKSISPLKEKNSPGVKSKAGNLMAKLRRRSASITFSEKENKSKK